jgi:hypothetical protein
MLQWENFTKKAQKWTDFPKFQSLEVREKDQKNTKNKNPYLKIWFWIVAKKMKGELKIFSQDLAKCS